MVDHERGFSLPRNDLDHRRRQCRRPPGGERVLEASQALDHCTPFGNGAIRSDEVGEGALDAVERGRRLHQPTQLHRA